MNRGLRLEMVAQDVRQAMRVLRRNPVFGITAVLTLALGIGGNTAMFTVILAVLLNPLEYRESQRLVQLSGGATPVRFAELKSAARSFTEVGAYTSRENLTLSGGGMSGSNEPQVLTGVRVSAGFLRILGIDPLRGRDFRPEEDKPEGAPAVMISAALWQRHFSSDPQVIGKVANLSSAPYTIVGVLPADFQFPSPGIDVWLSAPSEWPQFPPKSRALSPFLTLFGRLQPGVTLQQADAEMKVLRRLYAVAHPAMLDAKSRTPLEVTLMKDRLVAGVQSILWMLFGAVGFVLLIACANVANLLLTRATFREREFALRSALGAARTRLVAQVLTESVLLSLTGGVAGLLLAAAVMRAIPNMSAFALPRATEIRMDWAVFGFAAVLSVVTGVLFGLAPSLGSSRPSLMHVLRASGEAAAKARRGWLFAGLNVRNFLSVTQVALSVILLIGAALLLQSVAYLRAVDVGFNPASLITMSVSLPPLRYDTDQKKAFFFEEFTQRLERLPGVLNAAAALSLPMLDYAGSPIQDAAQAPRKLNERLIAKIFPVTPDYFRALQIPLRRGREFSPHDKEEAQRVAIIDESLARRFWPGYPAGQNPIGQRLLIGGVNPKPAEIIGVVADIRQDLESSGAWRETVYTSFAQNAQPTAMIAVRTSGDPLSIMNAVRRQLKTLDPDQSVASVRTMNDLVEAQTGRRRLLVELLGSFALVALLLALVGIYGVVAYSVAQRIQEMGIRRALGAQQSDILRLVIGQGVLLSLTGIVIGLVGAFALTRVLQNLLFHVSRTDPATFLSVAFLLLLVSVGASYIPARRAVRLDPIASLRV